MFDALTRLDTPYLIAIALIFGLLVGSFLNVVIHRLPKMMEREWRQEAKHLLEIEKDNETSVDEYSLVFPSSHCPHCEHKIRAWENIPVISWLFLKGRCSDCKSTISARYPIIELITGLLCAFAVYELGATWQSLAAMFLIWCLISLTMIDFDTQLLPDSITLPLLWAGLLINLFGYFATLQDAVIGAMVGYLSLWSVNTLFKLLAKKDGMGYGDFKLLAALGAWMGWQYILTIVLLSSAVGALVGILLIVIRGRDKNIPIPFGPYLAAAGLIAFFWGEKINTTYLHLSGLN